MLTVRICKESRPGLGRVDAFDMLFSARMAVIDEIRPGIQVLINYVCRPAGCRQVRLGACSLVFLAALAGYREDRACYDFKPHARRNPFAATDISRSQLPSPCGYR